MILHTLVLLWLFALLPPLAHSFVRQCQYNQNTIALWLAEAEATPPLGDLSTPPPPRMEQALLDAAKTRLPWEILLEKEQGPLLNLSRREDALSLSQEAALTGTTIKASSSGGEEPGDKEQESSSSSSSSSYWQDGSLWTAQSRKRLVDLWVLPRDVSNGADQRYAVAASKAEQTMLETVPQLLRLEFVVDTAKTVLALGLPPALLRKEPLLLSYPPDYIKGGFDFLSVMMMSAENKEAVLEACRDTPGLLVGAVDGFIQEQTIQRALNDAAQATSEANKKIAADVAKAYREIKGKKII